MKIELYTDGACRGNGTASNPVAGLGIVLIIGDQPPIFYKEELFFEPNTNNKAEIYAVIAGLKLLWSTYYPNLDNFYKDNLTIYSDSSYTINGITEWINNWRANGWKTANKQDVKNKELWQILDENLEQAKKQFNISFIKVKGHNGDRWNEKCDQLANEAMDNE